jgi:hypothetical protein
MPNKKTASKKSNMSIAHKKALANGRNEGRLNLRTELAGMKTKTESNAAEIKFLKVAKSFSQRNDITYEAWCEFGVVPAVLKRAGISK